MWKQFGWNQQTNAEASTVVLGNKNCVLRKSKEKSHTSSCTTFPVQVLVPARLTHSHMPNTYRRTTTTSPFVFLSFVLLDYNNRHIGVSSLERVQSDANPNINQKKKKKDKIRKTWKEEFSVNLPPKVHGSLIKIDIRTINTREWFDWLSFSEISRKSRKKWKIWVFLVFRDFWSFLEKCCCFVFT